MTDPTRDTATVIVGQSGAGKTVTAKHTVEQLLGVHRHVAIYDPTGVWYGLRSNAAGTGPGFDIPIFGGEHGDIPIRPTDGAAVARIILEQRVSAIVDLSAMDNSRDWRRFMDDHVATLRGKPKANFHPIFDEADEFAPERPADDIAFRLRENMVWLAKRGRVKGFVPTFITQRTAEIAWAVISQAQTIVAHQLIAPADQASIEKYLKSHGSAEQRRAVMESLAELDIGERWIYSPRLKILERGRTAPIATFDSSRTPAPGEIHAEPRTLAQLDVSAIRAALAPPQSDPSIPADAGEAYHAGATAGALLIARDRRIAELEEEASALREELHTVRSKVAAIGAVLQKNLVQAVSASLATLKTVGNDANLHSPDAVLTEPEIDGTDPALAAADDRGRGAAAVPPRPEPERSPPATSPVRGRRALIQLARVHPGVLTEAQWATLSGYTRTGGTWKTYKGDLRSAGLVEQADTAWRATDAGVAFARASGEPIEPMPAPGPARAAYWGKKIPGTGRMLDVLAKRWPHFTTREGLAADLGMSAAGGTFKTYLGRLRLNGLLDEKGAQQLRLSAFLMEKHNG